jgi:hypothetical protein
MHARIRRYYRVWTRNVYEIKCNFYWQNLEWSLIIITPSALILKKKKKKKKKTHTIKSDLFQRVVTFCRLQYVKKITLCNTWSLFVVSCTKVGQYSSQGVHYLMSRVLCKIAKRLVLLHIYSGNRFDSHCTWTRHVGKI